MTSDKKVLEIGNKEELPPIHEFAVGELTIAVEYGVSKDEVTSSISRALECSSSTENYELPVFAEMVRSKLLDGVKSVLLPVVEGTLEITSSCPTSPNKSSDNTDDGYITISRDGGRYSSGDNAVAYMKIPVKKTRQPDEVLVSINEHPVPNVTNIIVFDANEEGVRTMKQVLLEQIKNEQGQTQPSPTDVPCTVIERESDKHESYNLTECITEGIHELKLTSPKSLSNSKHMLGIKKIAPKTILITKPEIPTMDEVSAVPGSFHKLLSRTERPISRPVNNKRLVSVIKTSWKHHASVKRCPIPKENHIVALEESKKDSENVEDHNPVQVIQVPSTTVTTTRVQPTNVPKTQGKSRVEDGGLGLYVQFSSSEGPDVERDNAEVTKPAADSKNTDLDLNLAKRTDAFPASAASVTDGVGCHETDGGKEMSESVNQKGTAKSSDTSEDEVKTVMASADESPARNDADLIPDYRNELSPASRVYCADSNPPNNAAVQVESYKKASEIDIASAIFIIDSMSSSMVENGDLADDSRLPADKPGLVRVGHMEPNTAEALSLADVGDAPCNNIIGNGAVSVLNDATLQTVYRPDTNDSDPHVERCSKWAQDDRFQMEVVDAGSIIDLTCSAEAPVTGQLGLSENPDLDVDRPSTPVPLGSDYGLCLVPEHMIYRARKGCVPRRYKWVPPMVFPDHDYLHGTRKKDRKRKCSIQLKPCSVVLNRLIPSVLAQYNSSSDSSEEIMDVIPIPADNFNCFHCSVGYPSLDVLGEHIVLEHADDMFTCRQCSGQFASVLDCNNHIGVCGYLGESRSPHITYLCPQCNFSTKDDSELRGHIDTEHRVLCNHCCPICPFKCVTKSTLLAHVSRYHQLVASTPNSRSHLIPTPNMNEKVHELAENNSDECNTTCDVPQLKCMSEVSLKNHMHPYHAISTKDEASRASVLNSSIQAAMDLIEAEYQHECARCPFKAETKAALIVHMKYFHDIFQTVDDDSSTERDYLCVKCSFKCKRESEIREHNKTVHGESYHRCCECSYSARSEAELQMHMRYFHDVTLEVYEESLVELIDAVDSKAHSKTVLANEQLSASSLQQPETSNTPARNTVVEHNPECSTTQVTRFPLGKVHQSVNLAQQTGEVTLLRPLQRISVRQPSELLKPDLIPQQEPKLLSRVQSPVSELQPPSQPSSPQMQMPSAQLPERSQPVIMWPDLILQQKSRVLPRPQLLTPLPPRFKFTPRCYVRQPRSPSVETGLETKRVKCIFPTSRPHSLKLVPEPRLPAPAHKVKANAEIGNKSPPSLDPLANESGGIECPECCKTFTTYAALGHHIVKLHRKKKKVPIVQICKLCNKTFSSKLGLQRHTGNVHGVKCPDCLSYFSRKQIQQHMVNTHRSECFVCRCNFVATVDSVMRLHSMIEHRLLLDSDLISCPVCPPHTTKFKTLGDLDEHANQRHYFLFQTPC